MRRLAALAAVAAGMLVAAPASFATAAGEPAHVAGIRTQGGQLRSCAGLRAACTITTTRATALELRAVPLDASAVALVELAVLHRAPGARRLAQVGERRVQVPRGTPGVRIALRELAPRAGTWCIRSQVIEGAAATPAPPPTCVRVRPLVEIGWAGDIVVGSSYGLPPDGGRDQFAQVAHLLRRPDLMIGNYEGTLSRGGSARCSGGPPCYLFQAPPGRARNLRDAGFDVMNLANNHALDMGRAGRHQTVEALARVGVRSAGLPGRVTVVRVEDTRIGIVGISPYPGTTSMRSPRAVRALVRAARRRADVVVVCMHVGLEGAAGAHVPRGADYGTHTRAAARGAIDAGADVVFGSGPHVVRGVERHRGRWIVYSSGNFAGWRNFGLGGLTSQSGVVRISFDHAGRPSSAGWDPVLLHGPGIPHPDRSGRVLRRVAMLSREDFGRRGARFARDGSFR